MVGLGYGVAEGPEIEHDYYNFTALNHPPGHPARMLQDTFYVQSHPDVLLRTHTSPMQIRAMETQPPPIFIVVPGKVYRRDSDATHSPMFHQMEGLAIAEGLTLADLQGDAAGDAAGRSSATSARCACGRISSPSPSPASRSTSPASSAGAPAMLADGERCNLCKGQGWIEILGAGMVDPNVLGFVERERLRPRAGAGLRLRPRGRAGGDAAPRRPRPAALLRQRRADAGAVRDEGALLLAARVLRPRHRRRRSSPSGW